MSSTNLGNIVNYLQVSDSVGTAGQPRAEQFADIKDAGYEVIVNLATAASSSALPDERDLVTAQGMTYVHIPVAWESPTTQDLRQFFEVMDQNQDKKVFVHCAMNMRVSSFVFLYRVKRQNVPVEAARQALHKIWEPNEVWRRFIDDALQGT
jgi:protein tyrosine phosphatase (PTP) superfamily phosphohydrolase (DUF442 family)